MLSPFSYPQIRDVNGMLTHESGAFTYANEKRKGTFEAAHKGTVFLDEIGEMSAACQVKLLRVLQEGTIRPGARSETHVDARVITATNRNLALELQAGRSAKTSSIGLPC